MGVLYDARGNEWKGAVDLITGESFTDTRPLTVQLASLNAESVVELNGQSIATFDLRSGAFVGTISFQGTVDGVNWFDVPYTNIATQLCSVNSVLSGAISNTYVAHVGGFAAIRLRITAYTSGTVDVGIRCSMAGLRPSLERPYPTQSMISTLGAANTGVTATLPAAGAGLYHYITHISIVRVATAAVAGSAILAYTTTNLSGSLGWSAGNAIAAGDTQKDVLIDFAQPLKSSAANTATTIVAPAPGAAVQTRINVGYFVGA